MASTLYTLLEDSFESFTRNKGSKFEPEEIYILSKTYLCLSGTTAIAALGLLLHFSGWLELGFITAIGSILLFFGLIFIEDNCKNFYARLGMLLGFGFCYGQTLGPLLKSVIILNQAIILAALTGTIIVFVTFTLAALLSERGSYLFLGGISANVMNTMTLIRLLNFFIESYFIEQTELYVGLAAMSAFILYDTQNIVQVARFGIFGMYRGDYISHSLVLFLDNSSIFRRLLVILKKYM